MIKNNWLRKGNLPNLPNKFGKLEAMTKLYECTLIKDKYLYFPQMGMYWDIYPIKRIAGEDELGLNNRIDEANKTLKKLSDAQRGEQVWHPTLFLNDKQLDNLPNQWQVTYHPKVWFMLARPNFSYTDTTQLPGAGVWKPSVDLLWLSNDKVLLQEFNGSVENTANWLGHRFRNAKELEVIEYSRTIPAPDIPVVAPPSDIVYIHMKCPHCGKTIF